MTGQPQLAPSLVDQILDALLESIQHQDGFEEAIIEDLRLLVESGGLSQSDKVIELLKRHQEQRL